ncbi:MAG: histidine phosphatase family protein [Armatimonadota bacterium]|nr:histidine phosphatase family protein [Armatimonadota bacterium]MDR7427421.1 histidine phosphatase family protein [Armatimonadota bacterium]MDR7464574.1 histidine phosphatase family protein [Armatimonadota bacterium]MDR7470755.1 histidine phosphatase family protein [Armatimonadota bacterium]MDR7475000.1 histidine phosphatase family protein [Armatimonadota bacterium]
MPRILLIRHGQTEWNRRGIFRGRVDIPLSPTGIRQMEALAARVAAERPARVYTSPLQRALTSARILCPPDAHPPRVVEDLTDMSYGEWEGKPEETVRAQYPDLYARWLAEPHRVRPPGGESLAEVQQRVAAALREIARSLPAATVAVVAHRVVNKLLLCAALGIGAEGFWRIRQDTGCLNVLEGEVDRLAVVLLNDTCHLQGLEGDAADF